MTRTASPRTLAFSILAGPILWFIHFMIAYSIAEFGCRANLSNLVYFSAESIRVSIIIVTVLAVVPVAYGGLLAFRTWQGSQRTDQDHTHFLVVVGILLSALFLVSIIVTALPLFVLNVCDKAV